MLFIKIIQFNSRLHSTCDTSTRRHCNKCLLAVLSAYRRLKFTFFQYTVCVNGFSGVRQGRFMVYLFFFSVGWWSVSQTVWKLYLCQCSTTQIMLLWWSLFFDRWTDDLFTTKTYNKKWRVWFSTNSATSSWIHINTRSAFSTLGISPYRLSWMSFLCEKQEKFMF